MGNSDLSSKWLPRREATQRVDALARFREGHEAPVRAYCEAVCSSEQVGQAIEASFVDLVGRLRERDAESIELDELMLRATRSAAAGRFDVVTAGGEESGELCALVPELLAARANGELEAGHTELDRHVRSCVVCARTKARMAAADRAFATASPRT